LRFGFTKKGGGQASGGDFARQNTHVPFPPLRERGGYLATGGPTPE